MRAVNPALPFRLFKVLALGGTLLLSCVSAEAFAASQQQQQQWLLQQMRMGEALQRDDLVRDSLARLELIAPDHPQVLVGEIRQALADKTQAQNVAWIEQLMTRLRQQGPHSAALRQSPTAHREAETAKAHRG